MDSGVVLAGVVGASAVVCLLLSPAVRTVGSFYGGLSVSGRPPGLVTLVLSQVTTWIFARSLMNAAILGYFYGIAGALAYAAYYFSFLTGAAIVRSLRRAPGSNPGGDPGPGGSPDGGHGSVQSFLAGCFGRAGTACYNAVVSVRLVSEVFANLLVVGLLFGAAGSGANTLAVLAVGALTLGYSMLGGLYSSLRTDVFQMVLFLALLAVLGGLVIAGGTVSPVAIAGSSPDGTGPGWVLLAVALLQVLSYPLHDPVMMDRGFLSDTRTAVRSFLHATWLSIACVLAFGLLGVHAGLNALPGESLVPTLFRLFGEGPMLVFNAVLVVSAMSTLDSTYSSAAKLAVVDMGLAAPTVRNGRIAMAAFAAAGLGMVFLGSNDLFEATAVSGTAAMYLAPVILFSLWARVAVPVWSYLVAFAAACGGAALYFLGSSGYTTLVADLTGYAHKYTHLLVICVAVLAVGIGAFAVGAAGMRRAR
jgi:SSS family solute:Na+ symporter